MRCSAASSGLTACWQYFSSSFRAEVMNWLRYLQGAALAVACCVRCRSVNSRCCRFAGPGPHLLAPRRCLLGARLPNLAFLPSLPTPRDSLHPPFQQLLPQNVCVMVTKFISIVIITIAATSV